MSVKEKYKALLKTLHRVVGQARRYGVETDYSEVKRPTAASISRLEKVIERLRTKLWIGRVERQTKKHEEELSVYESEVIIENFRATVRQMAEDEYQLQYEHSFAPSERRTAAGYSAKSASADKLVGYGVSVGGILGDAIAARGIDAVAQSIQENGELLQQLAEDLVFAIYQSKYAKWGGGMPSYDATLWLFKQILLGENDT